ncbi:MAG: hypothetical protein M1822_006251 [Bathelium mastoideum]|nr:MAG: hypothetical protein M1822_006251 [Bathelium mastoideum]
MDDLEETIQVFRQCAKVAPDDPDILATLGLYLGRQYERIGKIDDLKEAFQLLRQAVEITPTNDPDLAGRLNNLSNVLSLRYTCMGEMDDLEEAIQVQRRAIKIKPTNDPALAGMLNNIGSLLYMRYKRVGEMDNLEEAIQVSRQAVKVTPDNHPNLTIILYNLGTELYRRYEHTEKISDLEEAIWVMRQAIEITPDNHPGLAARLNYLGNQLRSRYERIRKIDDLEEAIQVSRQAIEVTPSNHLSLADFLSTLGNSLIRRYEHTKKIDDLEEAIQVSRQAIEGTPNNLNLSVGLDNLGVMLFHRYKSLGKMNDFEEATRLFHQAIEILPDNHPELAVRLNNLGWHLMLTNIQRSDVLQFFERAWNCQAAVPFVRVRASAQAICLLQEEERYTDAYQLSVDTLEVLPRVHNRSLSHQDQQYVIAHFSGLAASACSLALQIGQPPEVALEVLEQGRAVILSLLMDDRGDTFALKKVRPDLCARYESLRIEVNTPIDGVSDQSQQRHAEKRRPKAIEELEECIQEIQQLEGFDRFQKGLNPKQMQHCATEGCIVVVNITDLRSDAIIVSKQRISSIPLLSLEASKVKKWTNQNLTTSPPVMQPLENADFRRLLLGLWEAYVKPILDDLGYQPSSIDSLPRIWWIGTGLASSLPFHAAGDPTESSYSRVISSYTPSIKALRYVRERKSSGIEQQCTPLKLLMVTMATTPGASDLPGTKQEKEAVEAAVGVSITVQALAQPDVAKVVQHMGSCNIVHFACHGVSNPTDPSESGLLLESIGANVANPEVDILSVRRVSEVQLPQAEIAYLSACSTAENTASRLEDEVLHVVSGFQVAGFKHVVGCLWPSLDNVCVEVAKAFYSNLLGDGNVWRDDRAVAVALHKAVVAIRESDEYRKRPLAWAQYVHFGA